MERCHGVARWCTVWPIVDVKRKIAFLVRTSTIVANDSWSLSQSRDLFLYVLHGRCAIAVTDALVFLHSVVMLYFGHDVLERVQFVA